MRPSAFGRKVTSYRAVALSARAVTGGADLPGIKRVVAEDLAVAQHPPSADIAVLVSDQTVVDDHVGVEVDLDFGIEGDHLQCGSQVFNEEFASFKEPISPQQKKSL